MVDSQNAEQILQTLAELYPQASCALDFSNPFELVVATVLSAQTTDVRVNQITPELFGTYPDAQALAEADPEMVEQIVRPLGFQRRRAGQLVSLAQNLVSEYEGEVPATRSELMSLAGVGRKTANVVLGNAFDHPAITVDTHVGRLARRWRWTEETSPLAAERDIAKVIPQPEWTIACHRIILHGRQFCHSRRPDCENCAMKTFCPSSLA
ncbi:endonuclease III [Boudabousia marimammalium]|uniref:Endonuclease III n=2 Tax=Boudabousia marimammalium TaxID=156892 RepID=A0A1Q5PSR6_9ACTO|nr:endonuclease III [Boudabousia marimammalium]